MPPKHPEAAATGLRLTLPGAPGNWHHIPDLGAWWFHPVIPTPCGGPGEPSVEDARKWAADPGLYVEVVDIPDLDAARAEYGRFVREARGIARDAAAQTRGDETTVAVAQAAALEE